MKAIIKISLPILITTIGSLLIGSLFASAVELQEEMSSGPLLKHVYSKEKKYYIRSQLIKVTERENCVFLEGKVANKNEQIKIVHLIQEDYSAKRIYNKITY